MEFKLARNSYLGFFSDTFRLLHVYMMCKKTNTDFFIESSNWNFGRWHDYFVTLRDSSEASGIVLEDINWNDSEDRQFTVADYKKAVQEVFIYTPSIYERVRKTIESLSLDLQSTVAIFIRRGDKLLGESVFIPTEFYVKFALTRNPQHIFVQTDDYRAFLEVQEITNRLASHVKVHTTCPPTKFGVFYEQLNIGKAVRTTYTVNGTQYINDHNIKYLESTVPQKPTIEYSAEEMKEHVEEMLVGILICQEAQCIVLDHMSNVGRYIVFSHPRGKEAILAIEDLNITLHGSSTRLIPPYQYTEDKYIRNPRYHSIYNEYI